ncbi:hypothetical protein CKF54_06905, partial [Psittacicella hinzii]
EQTQEQAQSQTQEQNAASATAQEQNSTSATVQEATSSQASADAEATANQTAPAPQVSVQDFIQMIVGAGSIDAQLGERLTILLMAIVTDLDYGLVERVFTHKYFRDYYNSSLAILQIITRINEQKEVRYNQVYVNEHGVDSQAYDELTKLRRQYEKVVYRRERKWREEERVEILPVPQNISIAGNIANFTPVDFANLPEQARKNTFALFLLEKNYFYRQKVKVMQWQTGHLFRRKLKIMPRDNPSLYLDFSGNLLKNFWKGEAFNVLANWVNFKTRLSYDNFSLKLDQIKVVKDNNHPLYKSPMYWNGFDLTNLMLNANGLASMSDNFTWALSYIYRNKSDIESSGYSYVRPDNFKTLPADFDDKLKGLVQPQTQLELDFVIGRYGKLM